MQKSIIAANLLARFFAWQGGRVFLNSFFVTAAHAGAQGYGGFSVAIAQAVDSTEGLAPALGTASVDQVELALIAIEA